MLNEVTSIAVKYGPFRDIIETCWKPSLSEDPGAGYWKAVVKKLSAADRRGDFEWWVSNVGLHVAHFHGALHHCCTTVFVRRVDAFGGHPSCDQAKRPGRV